MIIQLHSAALLVASAADESGLRPGLDSESVTPGTLGFIFTLLVVVPVIFLIRDMSKRIRRVRYNALTEAENAPPAAAGGSTATGKPADKGSVPGSGDGTAPVRKPVPDPHRGPDGR